MGELHKFLKETIQNASLKKVYQVVYASIVNSCESELSLNIMISKKTKWENKQTNTSIYKI